MAKLIFWPPSCMEQGYESRKHAPYITHIDIRKYRVPFPKPIEFALGRITHSATLFVRIQVTSKKRGKSIALTERTGANRPVLGQCDALSPKY
ncbi:MAG: hypothetical protein GY759_18935 [Chloroflexi bacterium]|nr:hypothetical protein [Chloroflexota bacterium]